MALLNIDQGEGKDYNMVFTGDLGRVRSGYHPFGKPEIPLAVPVDALIHEATYGGKLHIERAEAVDELGRAIRDAYISGKEAFILTAFSIERFYTMLTCLEELKEMQYFDGEIVLDSPL